MPRKTPAGNGQRARPKRQYLPFYAVVWIVSAQHWPRVYLRAELIERGYDAVGYATLAQALAALRHPHTAGPHIVVLELRGLTVRRDELEALAHAAIPTVALGGAVELNAPWVGEFEWVAVIQRPFTIGQVADVVQGILGKQG